MLFHRVRYPVYLTSIMQERLAYGSVLRLLLTVSIRSNFSLPHPTLGAVSIPLPVLTSYLSDRRPYSNNTVAQQATLVAV